MATPIPEHKTTMTPKTSTWKKPKKGGKPKRITASGPPGGPYTPGAKKQRAQAKELRKKTATSSSSAGSY